MGRIAWEYHSADGSLVGKVGSRIAFTLKPDSPDWDLTFSWTGRSKFECGNVTEARGIAEKMLADFAEQTGLTLPEDVEDEASLAQELVERLKTEVRWFQDGDTDQERAEYAATQALSVFTEWVKEHRDLVDKVGDDIEYRAAQSKLAEMHELLLSAQEELGVEVDREES